MQKKSSRVCRSAFLDSAISPSHMPTAHRIHLFNKCEKGYEVSNLMNTIHHHHHRHHYHIANGFPDPGSRTRPSHPRSSADTASPAHLNPASKISRRADIAHAQSRAVILIATSRILSFTMCLCDRDLVHKQEVGNSGSTLQNRCNPLSDH